MSRVSLAAPFAVLFACAGRPSQPALTAPNVEDPGKSPTGEGPCGQLCSAEAKCGSKDARCRATCARDEAILRPEIVAAIAACRADALKTACAGAETAFSRGDLLSDTRCLSLAVHESADADAANRRAWSEASCDRMLRCQATDVDVDAVRPICVSSTMSPKEQEEKDAMLVVGALRGSVVERWSACLVQGSCPAPGKSDDVAEQCLAEALRRSP